MTATPSLSRQASAVSILLSIVSGARTKPRNASELEMLLEDARAAERSMAWLARNKDAELVDAYGGGTIGEALT